MKLLATTGFRSDAQLITMVDSSVVQSIRNNRNSKVGCNFDITQLEEEEPLFLQYPGGQKFMVPEDGNIKLEAGQVIIADCLGTEVDSTCKSNIEIMYPYRDFTVLHSFCIADQR